MSKLECAVKDLIGVKEHLKSNFEEGYPPEFEITDKKKLIQKGKKLDTLGLLELDIFPVSVPVRGRDDVDIFKTTVKRVTPLGYKLIKLSQDEEKWEKVKNGDTSVIDDDDLKKVVKKLMTSSSP